MRADFANFRDVVCFDTTYLKNNEGRPIALFVGENHHKQIVIFGAALLYDETSLTFEWLFNTFTRAMFGEKPKTILTDQDAAIAKALALRWPETHLRLCIQHIYQNAANHLSSVFSEFKSFSIDFSRCIYDFEEEDEFIEEWNMMLDKYGLKDNKWLKQMFDIKEKWALVYGRQIFCADMTATQRSESMNSVLKRYVNYKHTFLEFFTHFERLIEDGRYIELKADFRANISFPALQYPCELLKNAGSIYTPEVFELFQTEWCKSFDSCCHDCGEFGSSRKYEITPLGKHYHHTVYCDSSNKMFSCTCRKFEFGGILCSHIFKVFIMRNVFKIPSEYILKRWTRRAKTGYIGVEESFKNINGLDPKVLFSMRYKELCRLSIQLITKATEADETYDIAKDGMLKMLEAVDTRLQANESVNHISNEKINENEIPAGEDGENFEGIKAKVKTTSGKRLESGPESTNKKKKLANESPAQSAAPRSSFSLCAEATKENTHATPGIPIIQYQMPEYYHHIQQFGPDRDDMSLVNPLPPQFDWRMQSSQIMLNQEQVNLAASSSLEETSCSINMTKLPETQQSQMLHQHDMTHIPAIGASGGSTFDDTNTISGVMCCTKGCGCPTPYQDGWCKRYNKSMDA